MKTKLSYFVVVIIFISIFVLFIYNYSLQHSNRRRRDRHWDHRVSGTGYAFNVFFIETDEQRSRFDVRQLCAIESAAKNNPDAIVTVLALNAVELNGDENFNRLVKFYSNVQLKQVELSSEFNRTFLADWWWSPNGAESIRNSSHSITHLSDLLRLWYLWKYGGFYSDLDAITVRSVKQLFLSHHKGIIGRMRSRKQNEEFELGNGILMFEKKHDSLLYAALKEFSKHYMPSGWSFNGPQLFERILPGYCNVTDIFSSLQQSANNKNNNNDCNVTIFEEEYFYPIPWFLADELFESNGALAIRSFMNTYSVHFYSKMTGKLKVQRNSIYEYFAKQHCPLISNLKMGLNLN